MDAACCKLQSKERKSNAVYLFLFFVVYFGFIAYILLNYNALADLFPSVLIREKVISVFNIIDCIQRLVLLRIAFALLFFFLVNAVLCSLLPVKYAESYDQGCWILKIALLVGASLYSFNMYDAVFDDIWYIIHAFSFVWLLFQEIFILHATHQIQYSFSEVLRLVYVMHMIVHLR